MSWDESVTSYHLTPRGWVTGDPPRDAVETWTRAVSQQSGWSREYISWACTWADPATDRPGRDALRKRHREFMERAGRSGSVTTTIGDPL